MSELIKFNLFEKPLLKSYIIFIFLFQLMISSGSIGFNVNYVKTFELYNENILICSDKGIYLFDKSLNTYNERKIFSNSISLDKFGFITINQFKDRNKYITVLYEKNIYILTKEGQICFEKNINFDSVGTYYTLVLVPFDSEINDDNSYYYFFIGYIKGNNGESQFIIDYFYFNNLFGDIYSSSTYTLTIPNYQYISTFFGFSCQLMKSSKYKHILTCFFHVNKKLIIVPYNLDNISQVFDELIYESDESINPTLFSSVISEDKTKSLICYLKDWKYSKCGKYNINRGRYNLIYGEENFDCKNEQFSTTLMYGSFDGEEFIFGCSGGYNNYFLIKFDSDFEIKSMVNYYQYVVDVCDCLGFSIVKFKSNDNYLIIQSCGNNKGVIYDNLPEGIKYVKTQNFQIETEQNQIKETY